LRRIVAILSFDPGQDTPRAAPRLRGGQKKSPAEAGLSKIGL
jgi:hypothetical protein